MSLCSLASLPADTDVLFEKVISLSVLSTFNMVSEHNKQSPTVPHAGVAGFDLLQSLEESQ